MNQAIVIVSFGTADPEAKASCLDAVAADGNGRDGYCREGKRRARRLHT